MKFKTTQKEIKSNYRTVIKIGYCSAQYLLGYETPVAYTCGTNGWNADVYTFGGVAIVTGYRPFGNVEPDYNLLRAYEEKAEEIQCQDPNRQEKITDLLHRFIDDVREK